jgi:hypothetical protein
VAVLHRINKRVKRNVRCRRYVVHIKMDALAQSPWTSERKRWMQITVSSSCTVFTRVSERVHLNRTPEKSVISPGPTRIFIKYELQLGHAVA